MANNGDDSVDGIADTSRDDQTDKSFMGKFVTGILNNTPLSKWFGGNRGEPSASVKRREGDDDDDDDSYHPMQPPLKRAKLPTRDDDRRDSFTGSPRFYSSPLITNIQNSSSGDNNSNAAAAALYQFPEPGPSGVGRRTFAPHHLATSSSPLNQNQDFSNDSDSDEEESTSGYSSAPRLSKAKPTGEKPGTSAEYEAPQIPTRSLFRSSHDTSNVRSLFSERSLSPSIANHSMAGANTSLSSRRPSFNASTFGSPSFVDKTLTTKRIMTSPFYTGQTTYGGASAYGRSLVSGSPSNRKSVQIKPCNQKAMSEPNSSLSLTARRILSTLEQYSTPISDAKKIPVQTPRERRQQQVQQQQDGLLSKYVGANPYLVRDKSRKTEAINARTTELQVPTVPELLKQKQRLQNSTVSVRQIATSSRSSLNEAYQLRTEEHSARQQQQKHSNKMKNSISSVRQKKVPADDSPAPQVNLPKVSLPITVLPKFNLILPPPSVEAAANQPTPAAKTPATKTSSTVDSFITPPPSKQKKTEEQPSKEPNKGNNCTYKFSKPLVLREDTPMIPAINCFKFSEPNKVEVTSKFKVNGENVIKAPESSTVVNSNGFGSQFNMSSDKWECGVCMVRNSDKDRNCVACTNPRSTAPAQKSGFGDKFKPASGTWECSACMIRNKDELERCVACETPKLRPVTTKPAAQPTTPIVVGFGDKFQQTGDTWECSTCMIRNKNELVKCAACETSRANAPQPPKSPIMSKFRPAGDTWECPTCMIRNKNDVNKCAACETTKPGASTTAASTNKFTFGVPPANGGEWECTMCQVKNKGDAIKCSGCEVPKNGFGDRFKTGGNKWECGSCMVRNQMDVTECVCCGGPKPGTGAVDASKLKMMSDGGKQPITGFNFGVGTGGLKFQFGIPPTTSSAETSKPAATAAEKSEETSFVFGVKPPAKDLQKLPLTVTQFAQPSTTVVQPTGGFTFGIKSTETSKSNPLLKPDEKLPEKAATAAPDFKFGVLPSSSNNNTTNKTTNLIFKTQPISSDSPSTSATVVTNTNSSSSSRVGSSSLTESINSSQTNRNVAPPTFAFKSPTVNGDVGKFTFGGSSGAIVEPKVSLPVASSKLEVAAPLPKPNDSSKDLLTSSSSNGFIAKEPAIGSVGVPSVAPPFKFGALTGSGVGETPAAPTFKFSGTPQQQNQANNAATTATFKFGSASGSVEPPVTSSRGFNFPTTTAAPIYFGTSAVASSAKNGTFNFGPPAATSNNNQKAVFTFGASQTIQQQQPVAAPQVSFGQLQQQPTSSSGGFSFNATPSLPPQPGGFNFTGAPPSFNFSDGNASSTQPQRRIRRALRRTTPR